MLVLWCLLVARLWGLSDILWRRPSDVVESGIWVELWLTVLVWHLRVWFIIFFFVNIRAIFGGFGLLLLRCLVILSILRNMLSVWIGLIFLSRLILLIILLTVWLLVLILWLDILLGSTFFGSIHHPFSISEEVYLPLIILLTVFTIESILVLILNWRIIFKFFLISYFGGVFKLITNIWCFVTIWRADFSWHELSLIVFLIFAMVILLLREAFKLFMKVVLRSFILKKLLFILCNHVLNDLLILVGILDHLSYRFKHVMVMVLLWLNLFFSMNYFLDLDTFLAFLVQSDSLLLFEH